MKTYIREIDGKWYAFAAHGDNQVRSIGADNPPKDSGSTAYFASWSDNGIKYISSSSASRKAAYEKARRYGEYQGEA